MSTRKIHATRKMIEKMFPVQGYGDEHYSRDEVASYPINGWWAVEVSPLVKGSPFKARRELI